MKNSLLNDCHSEQREESGTNGQGFLRFLFRRNDRRILLLLLALLLPVLHAAAQTAAPADSPEMADAFRADGKIYVVVAVVTVVLAGLLVLLVSLDRKVSRLERELKD
jgi:drug/metabolite transporter superfamily protein YnfA